MILAKNMATSESPDVTFKYFVFRVASIQISINLNTNDMKPKIIAMIIQMSVAKRHPLKEKNCNFYFGQWTSYSFYREYIREQEYLTSIFYHCGRAGMNFSFFILAPNLEPKSRDRITRGVVVKLAAMTFPSSLFWLQFWS